MASHSVGIIKFYNTERGYGYIKSPEFELDIFFHRSVLLDKATLPSSGLRVEFSAVPDDKAGPGKHKAISVEIKAEPDKSQIAVQTSSQYSGILYNPRMQPAQILSEWASITLRDNISSTGKEYFSCLTTLKDMALSESWDFAAQQDLGHLTILNNYLRFTFYKLSRQHKIAYSGDYATFNTGLVDNIYEPIYALFKKRKGMSDQNQRRPFQFVSFCVPASQDVGKLLIQVFEKLPEAASYFRNITDVVFDTNCKIFPQYEHIIDDAIGRGRYPLEFLRSFTPLCRDDELGPTIVSHHQGTN